MKKLNLLLFFIGFGLFLNAQSAFRVKVIDSETKDGIDKALVFIEEIGVPDQETDEFGVVSYQNIPENLKIKLSVRKKGYVPLKVDVVASRSLIVYNNKVVELQKEPTIPQIIIYGEVTDINGEEVKGATVEISVLGRPYKDVTDESGNYQIKIDGEVAKSISSFKLEAKKIGFEKFTSNVPKQDIVNKDIKLIYVEAKPIQEKSKPEPTPDEIRKVKEEQDRIANEQKQKAEAQRVQNEEHKKQERKKNLENTVDYITSIVSNNHTGPFSNRVYIDNKTNDSFSNYDEHGKIYLRSYFVGERYKYSEGSRLGDDKANFYIEYINKIEPLKCEDGSCSIIFMCINSGCVSLIEDDGTLHKKDAYVLKLKCNEATQSNLIDAFIRYKRLVEEK